MQRHWNCLSALIKKIEEHRLKHKVISWRNQKSLKRITESLFDGILTDSLVEHFRFNRPEYFVSDDSTWLRDAILEVHDLQIEDPFERLAQKIKENVRFLRAYHGCKPTDLTPYHKEGLVPLERDQFIVSAQKMFSGFNVSESIINEALNKISTEYREGRTWFVLDDRLFFEGAGHYLIYGGELLQSVAGCIQYNHGIAVHDYLENTGIPTVFFCDIPMRMIPDGTMRELAGTMLENYFEIIFDGRINDYGLNFGFYIKEPLSPSYIISHYHPKEIENPIKGRIIYRPKITECDFCR